MNSCSREKPEEEPTDELGDKPAVSEETKVPNVVFEDIDGESVRLEEFKGKFLVVNFFATWSNDSKKLIPIMNKIQRKFEKHATVIGVAMDRGGTPVVRRFIKEQDIKHSVFVNGENIVNRFGGAKKLPTTYILLRDGRIIMRMDGLKEQKHYEKRLIWLIAQRI